MRLALAQRLQLMAAAKRHEILQPHYEKAMDPWLAGEELDTVTPSPGADGTRLICASCQTPPPLGAIRFFKHGTDEFNR